MILHPKGNPDNKLWLILEAPLTPKEQGNFYSYGLDKMFFHTWLEAGLPQPFVLGVRFEATDFEEQEVKGGQKGRPKKQKIWGQNGYNALRQLQDEFQKSTPAILCSAGKGITSLLLPDMKQKGKATEASLEKYAGNLLTSPYIPHDHWIIPSVTPDYIASDYTYREIARNIDFGHIKEEWQHYEKNKSIRPLEDRELICEPSYTDLMAFLTNDCPKAKFLSTDIETIRPPKKQKKDSVFLGHPGYPYTLGLAVSPYKGISFSFWDYEPSELTKIWRELNSLFRWIPQIGQNYFRFDANFLEALGFTLCLDRCQDTLIRHHILWSELEHKLQFLTKQYTRIPYYKDEGKHWNPKQKKSLMHYNALDVVATYEVYNGQEEDFNQRPHLR